MEDKPRRWFDGTINLNFVLTLTMVIFGVVASYITFGTRLTAVETQVSHVLTSVDMVSRIDEKNKSQDERITELSRRLERLEDRRGRPD